MGSVGTVGSFGMLWLAKDALHLTIPQIQTYVFLKLAVAGHVSLFIARARGWMFERPWPSGVLFWSAILTKLAATLLVLYPFGMMAPIGWVDVAIIWAYALGFGLVTDAAKVLAYRWLNRCSRERAAVA